MMMKMVGMPRAGIGTWTQSRRRARCASSSCTALLEDRHDCASPEPSQHQDLVDQKRSVFWGRRRFPLHSPLLPCVELYLTSSIVAAAEFITWRCPFEAKENIITHKS